MAAMNLSAPALAAPDGVTPNFDDPPNGNGVASAAFILMMVISTLSVALQAYGKVWLTKKVHLDDVLILIAYGNYWGCAYSSYAMIYYPGYFVHNWNLQLGDTIRPYYFIFLFGVFYSVVLAMVKIAILVGWCRVFVPQGGQWRSLFWWGASSIIALQGAFLIAAIFLLSFQCIPHEAIWDFTITDKTCLPLNPLQLTSSTVHIVSDIGIFILPQKIIWGLSLSWRKKLGVAAVFGLGALAVICAILRLKATIDFGASPDTMYNIGPVILWATGEMSIGFFVVSAPSLPRVMKESPTARKLRQMLSIKSTRTGTPGGKGTGYGSAGRPPKGSRGTISDDRYHEIDEEALRMGHLQSFDSSERLRDLDGITRTMQITVTRDQRRESSDPGSPHWPGDRAA
ncbi:hypothetical protein F5Y15DRAFT_425598 [Xylariaceae sp. FL0016]|nr:hypothetical protein F5Y15DRAFT_425598 [Xylariaceae sp. FL0016]